MYSLRHSHLYVCREMSISRFLSLKWFECDVHILIEWPVKSFNSTSTTESE